MGIEQEMEQEVKKAIASTDQLSRLKELADRFSECEKTIKDQTALLKAAKKEFQDLSETTLPEFMQEIGIPELKLQTGEKIKVADDMKIDIPKKNQLEAFKWLEDNGAKPLLKNIIVIDLGKEKDEKADEIEEAIQELGALYTRSKSIHWQTLKAFINERKEEGEEYPVQLLGIYEYKKTTIKN